jgi:hypothetical protein
MWELVMHKKPIKPGDLCLIKGSRYNDGKMVTAVMPQGMTEFVGQAGTHVRIETGWRIDPPIDTWLNGLPIKQDVCEASVLWPIDNPGDDETDTVYKELPCLELNV